MLGSTARSTILVVVLPPLARLVAISFLIPLGIPRRQKIPCHLVVCQDLSISWEMNLRNSIDAHLISVPEPEQPGWAWESESAEAWELESESVLVSALAS